LPANRAEDFYQPHDEVKRSASKANKAPEHQKWLGSRIAPQILAMTSPQTTAVPDKQINISG
jgi:hypothetical protein